MACGKAPVLVLLGLMLVMMPASSRAQSFVKNPFCPRGQPMAMCLIQPCSLDTCKEKCAAYSKSGVPVQCQDNYCGGCSCDCCLPQKASCSTAKGSLACCKGLVCDISNKCFLNPLAFCAPSCLPPSESRSGCRSLNKKCDPDKFQCCRGLGCFKRPGWGNGGWGNPGYYCQKCRNLGETCSSTRPCCPYMKCGSKGFGLPATCQHIPERI